MRMWDGPALDAVDWRSLRGARPGSDGASISYLLSALAFKAQSQADCDRIRGLLEPELEHCGLACEAAPYAVPFLARLVSEHDRLDVRGTAAQVLCDVLGRCEPEDPDLMETLVDAAMDDLYAGLELRDGAVLESLLDFIIGVEGLTDRLRLELDWLAIRPPGYSRLHLARLRSGAGAGEIRAEWRPGPCN
jgi:hypothetical protein